MTTMMNAMQLNSPGEKGEIINTALPKPSPKPDEVLIKVAYAGINRADLFQKQGKYPAPTETQMIPGLEVSGTIEAVGPKVTDWKAGDNVCALLTGGGYAQYCTAAAALLLPIPDGLSMKQAASLPEATYTVWLSMVMEGNLEAGENFLVHGGASGIGSMAIQIATLLGAKAYTTARTPEKCQLCERLGAVRAINYQTEDFVQILEQETNHNGMNLILDMVGGDYMQKNINLLARDGRLVNIAFLRGARTEVNFGPLLTNRLKMIGSTLRSRSPEHKAQITQALRTHIWPALAAKTIKPVIDSEFSLSEVQKAHARMEENLNLGKIILQV